jgi:predicted ATPase with chaperone activity
VSLRSQDRLLRVARSVADLREAAEIEIEDLTQALALRLAFAAAPTESFTGTS